MQKLNINIALKRIKKINGLHYFDIANRLLIILIVGLMGHVAVKYFSAGSDTVPTIDGREKTNAKVFPREAVFFQPKPFEVYARAIEKRNLFQSIKDTMKTDTPALKKALPVLHKRIKLIGILLDKDSRAIVEDLKEKQIHFLSKGESIGTILLEDIQEDKVIFRYNSNRVELAL